MSKRLLAIVLSIVMLIGIVPTTFAVASSSSATLTVKANKTTVNPGDEVEFSVELAQTGDIAAVEAYVKLPAGMTLVDGSFTAATDKTTLGWDDFSVDEDYLMIYGYGSKGYTGTPLTLATFKCVVDANAEGQLIVELYDISALDAMMEDKYPVAVAATLNVEIPVTGVTLDKDTLALDTGDNKTATLVATVDPNKATNKTVTWDSSDKTVATVENGVVTALKHGTTTITVKTVDGGFTDVCVVTVTCAHAAKTPTNAKTANCQEGGWDAYYTCDACGQLFAADGTTKIDAIPTTSKDGSNHTNIQPFAADTATCTHKGHDAYEKCVDCGVVTSGSDAKYFGEHNYGELKTAVSEKHTPDTLTPAVAAHYQCSVDEYKKYLNFTIDEHLKHKHLDNKWKDYLIACRNKDICFDEDKFRIWLYYFIQRYFIKSVYDLKMLSKVKAAILSFVIISALDFEIIQSMQKYSKETEHNKYNLDRLFNFADRIKI